MLLQNHAVLQCTSKSGSELSSIDWQIQICSVYIPIKENKNLLPS